ncbi:hypothetical protein FOA52_007327 [Chlamydomonas sp. UWO 241]|nr:hypothetical protein FOA52_007327 [Chlamydomonas sp. UWO 241]
MLSRVVLLGATVLLGAGAAASPAIAAAAAPAAADYTAESVQRQQRQMQKEGEVAAARGDAAVTKLESNRKKRNKEKAAASAKGGMLAREEHERPIVAKVGYTMLKAGNRSRASGLPTIGKILTVVVFTVPIVIMGGIMYAIVTETPLSGSAIEKSYHAVTSAPAFAEEAWRPAARTLLIFLHITGTFTYASLIGIISGDVAAAYEAVNRGNYNLLEENHTVVLGWNKQTVSLLQQLVVAQQERRGGSSFTLPIVVLADKDKEEMDHELIEELGREVVNTKVITRRGSPLHMSDLQKIAAGHAKTIVIPVSPPREGSEESALSVEDNMSVTLANLNALSTRHQLLFITSFMSFDFLEEYAKPRDIAQPSTVSTLLDDMQASKRFHVTHIRSLSDTLSEGMARCAYTPGLSAVVSELMTQKLDGVELYLHHFPAIRGRTFGDARRMLEAGTLMGTVNRHTAVHVLNPHDDHVMDPDDMLLVVAEDGLRVRLLPGPLQVEVPEYTFDQVCSKAMPEEASQVQVDTPRARVLVLSHDPDCAGHVQTVVNHAPAGATVTVVSEVRQDFHRTVKVPRGVRLLSTAGNLRDPQTLVDAGLDSATSVIIRAHNDYEKETTPDAVTDAEVVTAVLQIQAALGQLQARGDSERTRPLSVVCRVAEPDTATMLREVIKLKTLPSGDPMIVLDVLEYLNVASGVLAQVGSQPLLRGPLTELHLLDVGQSLLLRRYCLSAYPRQFKWGQLQELARTRDELLLGYIKGTGEHAGKAILGVNGSADVALEDGDHLVVLGVRRINSKDEKKMGALALEKIRKSAKSDYKANHKSQKEETKHRRESAMAAMDGVVGDAWHG